MELIEWLEQGRQLVANHINKKARIPVKPKEVFVVWFSKTLQNKKALFGYPKTKQYFELTANEEKGKQFLDVYCKDENIEFDLEDEQC